MSDPSPEFSPPYRILSDGPLARRLIWTSGLWEAVVLAPGLLVLISDDGLGRTRRESSVLALLAMAILLLMPVPARRAWRYAVYVLLGLAAIVLAIAPRVPGGWAILLGLAAAVRVGRDLIPESVPRRPRESPSQETSSQGPASWGQG